MSTAALPEPTVTDPLLTRIPIDHEVLCFPYGFPVRIRSNSNLIMNAAAVSWKTYRQQFDQQPLEVRLLVSDSTSPAISEPPEFRSQGHLLTIVGDSENFACLDLSSGFSFGWVTLSTAENTEYVRQCFLDVMIYPLLEIRHMVTIHAACVSSNGKGFLLAGDSGAGKSSLAYGCARRNWTYISDDASAFVRDAATPLVIGHPQRFRFSPDVGELFPEFRGLGSTSRPWGEPIIEVRTHSLEGIRIADHSAIDNIVFLNRPEFQGGAPVLRPLPADEAWKRLSFFVWSVQMPEYEDRLRAVRRLLKFPIYEMRYGELDPAIDLLERLASGSAVAITS